jgi:hypothetical protein
MSGSMNSKNILTLLEMLELVPRVIAGTTRRSVQIINILSRVWSYFHLRFGRI